MRSQQNWSTALLSPILKFSQSLLASQAVRQHRTPERGCNENGAHSFSLRNSQSPDPCRQAKLRVSIARQNEGPSHTHLISAGKPSCVPASHARMRCGPTSGVVVVVAAHQGAHPGTLTRLTYLSHILLIPAGKPSCAPERGRNKNEAHSFSLRNSQSPASLQASQAARKYCTPE